MQKVLTAAQMREVDRLTTERYGIPSIILMENAAHAVACVITEKLGGSVKGKSIVILCGKGNNGGDGAALARVLWQSGAKIDCILVGKIEDTSGEARTNFRILKELTNVEEINIWEEDTTDAIFSLTERYIPRLGSDLIVDALYGTGLTRPLGERDQRLVRYVSQLKNAGTQALSLSIDIPSGLNSDSEKPIGENSDVNVTVTFTAPKPANVLSPASECNGELIIANIGSPKELIDEQPSQLYLAGEEDARSWLEQTKFSDDSYKNKRGHALLIAGSEDYSGAAVLAGNAAMRSGVGLVTLACPSNAKTEIASRLLPDVILKTIETQKPGELSAGPNAIAVGCGLDANDPEIEKNVRDVVEYRSVPVIVDASALWFFNPAKENHPVGETPTPLLRKEGSYERPPLILTPHEGEFLRLLGTDDKHAISDRVAAVREFSQTNNVILVLKGERVLIGEPGGKVVVNPTGNSGLGKAGNGDTLTGILAGFVAQASAMNIDIFETVVAAVYIAGVAGDIAEKKYGKRVMTASDVRECLAETFRQFEV